MMEKDKEEAKLSSHFSPHLDILPSHLPEPFGPDVDFGWLDSNPGRFARLLIQAHRKHTNRVELAAKVARRTLEILGECRNCGRSSAGCYTRPCSISLIRDVW